MTDVHGESPTESMDDSSDPRAIARRLAEQRGEERPESIGPYKILQALGEGGMGVVYLAEQTSPVHRRVALKIIKPGMDTRQVMARFETEREALALMNHPNVAKVFDAGATEQGRPYFVMEYVPGIPITEYCDKHRLSTEERLRLFMNVCHAVQHAHQKGIIHRDIKPGNLLVSIATEPRSDAPMKRGGGVASPAAFGAQVKVIDFGVAKATQKKLTEQTLFTEQGQLIGTPGYMSPEQAEMTALDIDTRTDIYSLGVVLYELLVGARPFDDELLRKAGLAEIQRIIRETDPPKPSTRLSSLGDTSTQIAQKRRTELRTLSRMLRGDLDWIVMNCLEKDRTRRYDTANGLALELERYLNNEPVLAGPPSTTYRLRKFLRRNKGPVAAVLAVVVVLVAGLAGTTYGLARAVRAQASEAKLRRVAEMNERRALDAANRAKHLAHLAQMAEQELIAGERRMERLAATRATWSDPFKVGIPDIDWSELEVVEEEQYVLLSDASNLEAPPVVHETEQFVVHSTNARLSKFVAEQAEFYVSYINDRLFASRVSTPRTRILVYRNEDDYKQHGGSARGQGKHDSSADLVLYPSDTSLTGYRYRFVIEDILPHEITHELVRIFFGRRRVPLWLHEALATRFQRTSLLSVELQIMAIYAADGEFVPLRDLFDRENYPEKLEIRGLYRQANSVVQYLLDRRPGVIQSFLAELAAGKGHDAACASALHIQQQGAVEELERRWLRWLQVELRTP